MHIQVVPHNVAWKSDFETEGNLMVNALGETVVALHHIGSTAIPGIYAKPIIDFLLEVDDITHMDDKQPVVEQLGYEALGEFGIPGRRYFRKNNAAGIRTHQIHTFQTGNPEIERHLAFRDYMVAHPEAAQAYSALKQKLAQAHPDDIEAYMDGKDPFIKDHEAQAITWYRHQQP